MKRLFFTFTLCLIFITHLQQSIVLADDVDIVGLHGVSIDAFSGEILYDKDSKTQAYPASITKVLTGIIADEELDDDAMIEISEEASLQEPSNDQLLLKKGDKLSKKDALDLLMIISSNDVAYALAETVSGSIEKFSELMNKKAKELGALNSHFITPNGLPNPDHKTTAYDMALIGREALNHPMLLESMGKDKSVVTINDEEISVHAKHKIFELNPDAIGGKTGWTVASGNTLLEILEKDKKQIVTVVLKTSLEEEYNDINKMSNYAFDKIKVKTFYQPGQTVKTFKVDGKKINLTTDQEIIGSFVNNSKIDNKIVWTKKKNLKQNDVAAQLILYNENKEEIKNYPLKIDQSIQLGDEQLEELKEANFIDNINTTSLSIVLSVIFFIPILLAILLFRLTKKEDI